MADWVAAHRISARTGRRSQEPERGGGVWLSRTLDRELGRRGGGELEVIGYWGEEEEKGRGRPFPLRGALGPSTLLSYANWDIKWECYVSH